MILLAACASPEAVFTADVVPVLEQSCASTLCHGYAPGADEVIDPELFFFPVEGGRVDPVAARAAALRAIDPGEDPLFSPLIRKPLATAYGGLPHAGGDNFLSPDDDALAAIARWIRLEHGGASTPPLTATEQRFRDEVQPALRSLGCMTGSCHGPSAAVPFRLDPGIGGAFSTAGTRANAEAAAAMLADGDPLGARLVRKLLPLWDGGIVHKGGNGLLTRDDPRLASITGWSCEVRDCAPQPDDFFFVRGPADPPRDPFELDVYTAGTQIWHSRDGAVVTLPGDSRDPAPEPAGTRLAFAHRPPGAAGHAIWVLDRATGDLRAVTETTGTDRDPAWGPDGQLWFASTRAGLLADGGRRLDADLYTVDPDTGAVARRTWTPHVERKPTFFAVGEEAGGEMGFSALREALPSQRRAHPFRMPPGLDTEYHQHFGITPPETLFYDLRELPDGRFVAVVGDLDAGEGALGIIDRNFGPELREGASSLPFYAPPLVRLDTGVVSDPAPLPDGRVLFAAGGRIERLSLETGQREVVADDPALDDRDPEPAAPRREPFHNGEWAWDPSASTAVLRHGGFPMIDALLTNLPPSGEKIVRDDFVAVRLVEHLPLRPDQRRPVPPEETRDRVEGATTTGLGPLGPARILAEVPLEADGTFQIEVPAGVAFRLQGLDAAGRAIGHPHNRWFDVAPGQVLAQGVSHDRPTLYETRCAACHGARDGDPAHVFVAPDVVTTASITLARYEGGNPRRPREPSRPSPVTVDFRRDVLPALAGCAACHDELTGAPTAHYVAAYEALWPLAGESAVTSPLMARLDGGHGDLSEAERAVLARWIDLGATFVGEAP